MLDDTLDKLVGHLEACQGECQVTTTLKCTTLHNISKLGEYLPFPWEQSQGVVILILNKNESVRWVCNIVLY